MSRLKGIVMIIAGAMLWGATGPMMEWLLDNTEMTVSFMLVIRLLFAGALLLTMLKMQGKQITLPWRSKFWARQLLIFGIVGMLGVQYTFVATINESSAVIATLFQFLSTYLHHLICIVDAPKITASCSSSRNVRHVSRLVFPVNKWVIIWIYDK